MQDMAYTKNTSLMTLVKKLDKTFILFFFVVIFTSEQQMSNSRVCIIYTTNDAFFCEPFFVYF